MLVRRTDGEDFAGVAGVEIARQVDEVGNCYLIVQVQIADAGQANLDVPIAMGNLNSGILALVDGKFISITVPYPMGFFPKNVDGRIDDPNAGWKGRGLWTTSGDRTPWLKEGGKGTKPIAVHFQLRPDPLAH